MKRRELALVSAAGLTAVLFAFGSRPAEVRASVPTRAASGQLRAARLNTGHGIRVLPAISAGVVDTASGDRRSIGAAAPVAPGGAGIAPGATAGSIGCSKRNAGGAAFANVRVNQDCTYRVQAEEVIKFNPANPSNLLAGMNDERQGYNLNAFAYSFDGGKTWGDGPPPWYQKINRPENELATPADPNNHTITGLPGNGFTYDGGSDPAVAFDLAGRAFYGNVVFDRFLGSGAAVMVTQSPVGAGGSFFQTPTTFSRHYVIAEDNDPTVFHDKPFITVDDSASSPNRDNVYVTWTVFRFDPNTGNQTQSPIYGSMSTDHALTWSTPELISGSSTTLCFFGNVFDPTLDPHACNQDSGSDPVALPNGDLAVVFNSGNSAPGNPNSLQLGLHCKPAGSSPAGTAHLNCGAPVKVGDDITVGEPFCNFGRGPEQCIPGSYVRTSDFPRMAVNQGDGHLYANWPDYRGGEYDIQVSRSTDGGLTWTEAKVPVNQSRGLDHYQQAIDVVCKGPLARNNAMCRPSPDEGTGNGGENNRDTASALCAGGSGGTPTHSPDEAGTSDNVAVDYYRTCRVPNETLPAGCSYFTSPPTCPMFAPGQPGVQAENSDYTLVGGLGLRTPYTGHAISPAFPPPNGTRQTGFMGDYSGITVIGSMAHAIWADPRNPVPAAFRDPDQPTFNDDDVFTVGVRVPSPGGE